jgi:hypothetical protein
VRGYAVAEAGIGRTVVTRMSGLPFAARGGNVVAGIVVVGLSIV